MRGMEVHTDAEGLRRWEDHVIGEARKEMGFQMV